MFFIENQKPVPITIPENATKREEYAASELCHYLNRMTGTLFSVTRGEDRRGVCIKEDSQCPSDCFHIRCGDGFVRLTGGKRGVIYSVYEVLEKLGARFFTPECERVPFVPVPFIEDFEKAYAPAFEYREHAYFSPMQNPRFAVKCRFNANTHLARNPGPIKDKYGGNISYAWFVHTFERMLPPEKYAASHPEYYSLVDGRRVFESSGRHQLCLTNPEVLKVCAENIREALKKHPEAEIISVSQNDWGANCQCENCQKSDLETGSPAGTLLRFVNGIAEILENEFPGVLFDTLAYGYTRPAPKGVKNRRNVCVRLCSIECCFSHPFESCDDTTRGAKRPDGTVSSFVEDLKAWSAVCDRIYIWDYATCFPHYPTPHPNWRCLQPNLRLFYKNNVKGVFEQGNWCEKGGTDLNELRLYLYSKLMWDTNADVETHTNEFLSHYYGDAAPELQEYITVLCDKVEGDKIHVGYADHPVKAFLSEEMLGVYDALFDRAAEKVKGDPLRLFRVEKARLSLRYVRLKRKAMLKNEIDGAEINQFFSDWKAFGLSRLDEWCSAETTHRAMLDNVWRGTSYYNHWKDEGQEEF